MDNENQLVIYCEDDGEYRVYSDVCDNLCIQRYYKNHLKSQTHINYLKKSHLIKYDSSLLPLQMINVFIQNISVIMSR